MKKHEELYIDSIQYVYDKEFEKQWKVYCFSLVRKELSKLLEDVSSRYEENEGKSLNEIIPQIKS